MSPVRGVPDDDPELDAEIRLAQFERARKRGEHMIFDLPFDDYLAHEGVGSGAVRAYLRSPSHFQEYLRTRGEPPTPAQAYGTLIHTVVLEPRRAQKEYAPIVEGIDRRTKAGKEAYAMLLDANRDKKLVPQQQWADAWAMRDSLLAMPEYRREVASQQPHIEVSALWTDPDTGLKLKARADIVRIGDALLDLKSAADASPHAFASAIARYGYHCQAAQYLDGFGDEYKRFGFVAIEKARPFAAGIYWLDEASLELGRQRYRQALAGIARCEHEGMWPVGYGAQEISLPAYAFYENETEGEIEL